MVVTLLYREHVTPKRAQRFTMASPPTTALVLRRVMLRRSLTYFRILCTCPTATNKVRGANFWDIDISSVQEQQCSYVPERSVGLQSSALKGLCIAASEREPAGVNLGLYFRCVENCKRLTNETTLAGKRRGRDLPIS